MLMHVLRIYIEMSVILRVFSNGPPAVIPNLVAKGRNPPPTRAEVTWNVGNICVRIHILLDLGMR